MKNWKTDPTKGYRWRHRVEACSCGPLVYIRTLKCASTFFFRNLVDNYRWEEIRWMDIDWQRQKVFSHMLDPIERRHQGIAEYLFMTGTNELFYTHPGFKEVVANAPVLDMHSQSYFDNYGSYCWMIDWIPMNISRTDLITVTNKLMASYGQVLTDKWDMSQEHVGAPEKKKLVADLRAQWQENGPSEVVKVYFERDVDLYQQVAKNFNHIADHWNEMSWLREQDGNY